MPPGALSTAEVRKQHVLSTKRCRTASRPQGSSGALSGNRAAKYVPEGYTIEYRKSLSGMHYGNKKLIKTPRPTTRKSLYIFLHECGHAHLGHAHNGKVPRHVEEMEAEKWAHQKMRENGVSVPRSMTKRAKRYVAWKIRQAERRGAKKIDAEAKRFALG